jgi:hypothetical protein
VKFKEQKMSNSWDEMRQAKEDMFFEKQNREALEKLKAERMNAPRKSPITGEPMEQVAYRGVVIDQCKASGGIWLDAGELEKIIQSVMEEKDEAKGDWLSNFLGILSPKK